MGYDRYLRTYGRNFWIDDGDKYSASAFKSHTLLEGAMKQDIDSILEANWKTPAVIVRALELLVLNTSV